MNAAESEASGEAKTVQTFREAFRLIDQDSDSKLSKTDIESTLSSVGIGLDDSLIDELLNSRPANSSSQELSFPVFLTMFKEKLDKLDKGAVLAECFESFDNDAKGFVNGNELLNALQELGDATEMHKVVRDGPFTDRMGNFHYSAWIESLSVIS